LAAGVGAGRGRYIMKRLLPALGLAILVLAVPVRGRAHDAYDDSQSHPLLLASYAIAPVGFALEWLITRPIHFVVSQPRLEHIFGHVPHENPMGGYEAYEPTEQQDR
jgi:hypothetical protein